MSFSRKFFNLFFLLILAVSIAFSGCRTSEVGKEQVQELEKVDNQLQKAYQKEYEEGLKRHREMQSEKTREMMKQRKKQEKQYNKNQERSLWDRLFRKKCKTEFGNG